MEMKTAYDLAVDRGVTVILGDRPLEITWQRLVKQIDFWSSLRLLLSAVLGTRDLLRDDADEAPHIEKKVTQLSSADPDTVESLLKKFKKEIPSVYRVLVEERDQYLLWSARDSKASRVRVPRNLRLCQTSPFMYASSGS